MRTAAKKRMSNKKETQPMNHEQINNQKGKTDLVRSRKECAALLRLRKKALGRLTSAFSYLFFS
jgi:hypothetical protein